MLVLFILFIFLIWNLVIFNKIFSRYKLNFKYMNMMSIYFDCSIIVLGILVLYSSVCCIVVFFWKICYVIVVFFGGKVFI